MPYILQYISANWIELTAALLAIMGVYLTAKEVVLCWPVGIASCLIYTVIFYQPSLFADTALQLFYVALSIYGWYEWLHGGKNKKELHISTMPVKTYIYLGIIGLVASAVLIKLLYTINDSMPWGDGITSVLSIIATWMMAKKLIENWLLWIIIDLAYVPIYIAKDLYVTAVLYFIFMLQAVYGYYTWKKQTHPSSVLQS